MFINSIEQRYCCPPGGQNNKRNRECGESSKTINFIIHLEYLLLNSSLFSLYGHSTTLIGDSLFIFGGCDCNNEEVGDCLGQFLMNYDFQMV